MAERYGTHRPRRRLALVVTVVLVAGASLGWLAWAAWFRANPAIQAAVASFDVKSQHRIDATVEIRVRDRYVTGSCLLRASARDHSVVGELNFRVEDDATKRDRVFHLRTERLATTVEIIRCTADSKS
ncbi:MAG: DUF4307 domain-containing protein [Marmoricola sp.]